MLEEYREYLKANNMTIPPMNLPARKDGKMSAPDDIDDEYEGDRLGSTEMDGNK